MKRVKSVATIKPAMATSFKSLDFDRCAIDKQITKDGRSQEDIKAWKKRHSEIYSKITQTFELEKMMLEEEARKETNVVQEVIAKKLAYNEIFMNLPKTSTAFEKHLKEARRNVRRGNLYLKFLGMFDAFGYRFAPDDSLNLQEIVMEGFVDNMVYRSISQPLVSANDDVPFPSPESSPPPPSPRELWGRRSLLSPPPRAVVRVPVRPEKPAEAPAVDASPPKSSEEDKEEEPVKRLNFDLDEDASPPKRGRGPSPEY